MNATLIGLTAGIITILITLRLKQVDKIIVYGLILLGIGFLYIGFNWSNIDLAILSLVQAFVFLLFAFFGIKKSIHFLVAGYILHGAWDIAYDFFVETDLRPPHYGLFCMTYDFIVGVYLLFVSRRLRGVSVLN